MREKDNGMRLTSTRSRKTKNGTAFSTIHNDRNFDTENAPHIDPEKSSGNTYWHCFMDTAPHLTFEEVEEKFYQDFLSAGQEAKNQRYIKSGHREDCRTLEQLRKEIAPPEEMIFQIGRASEGVGQPNLKLTEQIWGIYKGWHEATYPQIKFLDYAAHDDEFSIHIHSRQVYCALDKDGNWIPNMEKCLEQMGISRPFPEKKRSRYNNRKIVYTKDCRDKLFEICKEMGLELIMEPLEKGRSGRSIDEIRTEGIRKDLEKAQRQKQAAQVELKEVKSEMWDARMELGIIVDDQKLTERALVLSQKKLDEVRTEYNDVQRKVDETMDGLDGLIGEYYTAEEKLDSRSEADRILEFLANNHPEALADWNHREQEVADFWRNLRIKQSQQRTASQRIIRECEPVI